MEIIIKINNKYLEKYYKDRRAQNRRLPRVVTFQSGKFPKIKSELEWLG